MLTNTAKRRLERLEDDLHTLTKRQFTLEHRFEELLNTWENEQHALRSITGRLNRALRHEDGPARGPVPATEPEGLDPISAAIHRRRALSGIPQQPGTGDAADGGGEG